MAGAVAKPMTSKPRGSMYTTIRELGPKIPYDGRSYGSQFPNGCICGPCGEGFFPTWPNPCKELRLLLPQKDISAAQHHIRNHRFRVRV